MGSTTNPATAYNDLLLINGLLTLDASATYTILLGGVNLTPASPTPADATRWNLITATGGITGVAPSDIYNWNTNTNFQATLTTLLDTLGLTGLGQFALQLSADTHSIQLAYTQLETDFHWAENKNGTWFLTDNWEQAAIPNAATINVFFIRDQLAGNGTADLNATLIRLGNLTIGSENGTDGTHFTLTNGALQFNNKGNASLITHHANAQPGDTIDTPIQLANDLILDIQSQAGNSLILTNNARFILNGTAQADITKTGQGTLQIQTSAGIRQSVGNLTIEQGTLYLSGGWNYNNNPLHTILLNSPDSPLNAYNIPLDNYGVTTLTNNSLLNMMGYTHFRNYSGALLEADNSRVTISGTDANFTNTGNIILRNGSSLHAAGTGQGSFVNNDGGNITLANSTLTNVGNLRNYGNITLTALSTLYNASNFYNSANLSLTGSSITNTAYFANYAGANITLDASNLYNASNLNNSGNIILTAGSTLNARDYSKIVNNAGALITLTNSTLHQYNAAGAAAGATYLTNAGDLSFANSTLLVNTEVPNYVATTFTNTGNITATANSHLTFNRALLTLTQTTDGNSIFLDNSTLTLANLTQTTATLSGTGLPPDYVAYGIWADSSDIILDNTTFTFDIGDYSEGMRLSNSDLTLDHAARINLNLNGNSSLGLMVSGDILVTGGSSIAIDISGTIDDGILVSSGNFILSNSTLTGIGASYDGILHNSYGGNILINDGSKVEITSTGGNGIFNYGTCGTATFNITGEGTTFNLTNTGNNGIYNSGSTFFGAGDDYREWKKTFTIADGATLNLVNSGSAATDTGLYNQAGNLLLTHAILNLTNNGTLGDGVFMRGGHYLLTDNARFTLINSSTGNGITLGYNSYYLLLNTNATLVLEENATLDSINTGSAGIYIADANATLILNSGATLNSTNDNATGAGIHAAEAGTQITLDDATLVNTVTQGAGIRYASTGNLTLANGALLHQTITAGTGIDAATANLNLTGATLVSLGAKTAAGATLANINLNTAARILNDTTLTATTLAIGAGDNLLAGNGIYYTILTGATAATTLSPGGQYQTPTGLITATTGTLTLNNSQTLNNFTLDWQMGSTTDTTAAANDLLLINGLLTLNTTSTYTILLGSVNLNTTSATPADGTLWTLITATGIANITNTLLESWNLDTTTLLSTLGLTGIGEFTLQLSADTNSIQLLYTQLITDFHWATNKNGTWQTAGNWEENAIPTAAGTNIYFIRNQTAADGTANLNGNTLLLGNLTIGAENATATDTHYNITNGTLTFDNRGNTSLLTQHANAQGDEISAHLRLNNDLEIDTQSATKTLLLSGNLTANTTANLTKTGQGTLILTGLNSTLGTGALNITAGAFYLNDGATLTTTGLTTVSAGAILGGNGTLISNIKMDALASAIAITGKTGAKYHEQFTIKGDLGATAGFTLNLYADFSDVHVSDIRAAGADGHEVLTSQIKNSGYSNNLFLNGSLLNLTANYNINITNMGLGVKVTDWSLLKKSGGLEVGFLLFTITNAGSPTGQWNLTGLNASDGWSLQWMENASTHNQQLWLFYANPKRIPEPATTALILGLLMLAALVAKRRQK
jgi:hypothetical protein